MPHPMVSIVIPCHNAAPWVGAAIESALAQTYPHKETIVIDDGSTDDSLTAIKSFGSQIRWETGPNLGGCAARNRGLEMAQGDMIQFLDADDCLCPEKLARQVPVLMAGNADIVTCEWRYLDGAVSGFIGKGSSCVKDPVVLAVQEERLGISSPLHWRKNLLAIGGFSAELPCAQEFDLHIRLACSGFSFCHIKECLWFKRRTPGSVASDYRRVLQQHLQIFERAKFLLIARAALTEERGRSLARACIRDAIWLFRLGDPALADEYVFKAREFHSDGGRDYFAGDLRKRFIVALFGLLGIERLRRFTGWFRHR